MKKKILWSITVIFALILLAIIIIGFVIKSNKKEEPSSTTSTNTTESYSNETEEDKKKDPQQPTENESEEKKDYTIIKDDDHELYKNLILIKTEDLKELIKGKKSFVFVITNRYCSHCTIYKPVINEVAGEYNIKTYYIDLDGMSATEMEELKKIVDFPGTPHTVLFKKGKIKARIRGSVEKEAIIDALKTYKFL